MFLLYAVAGAWIPVFTLRLTELAFSHIEIGWVCASSALASLVGPFVAGQVADRWFPAQRCVACCAFVGGSLLWLLAELTVPATVFWTALAFWLVMVPATTLTISICFAHLDDPERSYGPVRMWGTVGWVVPGLLLGVWFAEPPAVASFLAWLRPHAPRSEWADALRLGGLIAFVLSAYALTLPHTPPTRRRKGTATSWLAPLAALRLLRKRSVAVYCACALAGCVAIPFSSQLTSLLLQHLGVSRALIMPMLTIAQSMEIVTLATLPLILLRLHLLLPGRRPGLRQQSRPRRYPRQQSGPANLRQRRRPPDRQRPGRLRARAGGRGLRPNLCDSGGLRCLRPPSLHFRLHRPRRGRAIPATPPRSSCSCQENDLESSTTSNESRVTSNE